MTTDRTRIWFWIAKKLSLVRWRRRVSYNFPSKLQWSTRSIDFYFKGFKNIHGKEPLRYFCCCTDIAMISVKKRSKGFSCIRLGDAKFFIFFESSDSLTSPTTWNYKPWNQDTSSSRIWIRSQWSRAGKLLHETIGRWLLFLSKAREVSITRRTFYWVSCLCCQTILDFSSLQNTGYTVVRYLSFQS